MTRVRRSGWGSLVMGVTLLLSGACRGEPAAMDRESFITVYVDLRTASLPNRGGQITAAQKDEVLARHGVTEEDLTRFAEVHGRDVDYMAEVWGEVETRLHPQETPPPTPP